MAALWLMASITEASTVWITNSRSRRILRAVSLGIPGSLLPGAKITRGGREPKQLKKEKGAALILPSSFLVVTHAMGRGVMTPARIEYAFSRCSPSRSNSVDCM